MLAAVAPAAPAIGEAAVALALFLAFAIAYGLLWVYRSTLGTIVLWLADELDAIAVPLGFKTVHLFGPVSSLLRSVDRAVDHGLAAAALNTERGAAWLWNQSAHQLAAIGAAVGGLAYDVEQALTHAATVTVPNAIYTAQRHLGARIRQLEAKAAAAAAAGTAALHRFEAVIGARVGRIERDAARTAGRLRHLEKALTAAGAAVLVSAALARLGMGWLRCRNVKQLGKRACGMDFDVLDALLAGTLLLSGPVSLERLTRELLEETTEVERALRAGFHELRQLKR